MILSDILRDGSLYVEIGPLVFVWAGGQYIDVLIKDEETGMLSYSDRNINVWDYDSGTSTIITSDDLIDRVTEWVTEQLNG
jgi:hypothetical protein